MAVSVALDMEATVRRAASGDAGAFSQLVDASSNAVTSIALAICRDVAMSEDVAQEVYLVVWRRLAELRNPASFLPWIRQITRYTARAWVRERRSSEQRQARQTTEDDLLSRAVDPASGPEGDLLDRERAVVLRQTLADLPDEIREVVILYYREGRSTKQVATLLGLNDGAVRKRLQRARDQIRRDVLVRFAQVAEQTAPGVAFSAAVAASLAAAPTASAAALAASAATDKLGLKVLAGLGGAGLGFFGGAAGVVLGLRCDFREAVDEEERQELRKLRNAALASVALACILFCVPLWRESAAAFIAIFAGLLLALGWLYLLWLPKILRRRFMVLEQGDVAAVSRRLRARQRTAVIGWLLGALSGGSGLLYGLWGAGLIG